MSLPYCPKCDSGSIVQDPRQQGHNRCQQCGHSAPVRDFHGERVRIYRQGDKPPPAARAEPARHYSRPAPSVTEPVGQHFWWQDT